MYIEKDFLIFINSFSRIKTINKITTQNLIKMPLTLIKCLWDEYNDYLEISNSIDRLAEDEGFKNWNKLN